MSFGAPWWLWGLAGIGGFALILLLVALDPRTRAARWPRIARVTASGAGVKSAPPGRPGRLPWFLLFGAAIVIVALAHPRWGKIDEPVVERGREVMIALDLSRSMLVADVPPSRLERAKLLTQNLLDSLKGERVGLIVFAGTAFVQVPLSADYQILHEFLPELNPAYMPQGGTDYDGMLRAALGGFGSDNETDRFLIVLSDGESQTDTWRDQLPELRKRGVRALTLGIGTPAGSFIPDGHGAYLKDERGAVVLSKLETGTLQSLASETHGTFRNASEWVDLPALLDATIARGRQGRFAGRRNERFLERFQWFLAPAVLIGLFGLWHEVVVRPRQKTVRRASAPEAATTTGATITAVLALMLLSLPHPTRAADAAATPTPAPDARVRETIARLTATPQPTARDWRELADRTLVYGSGARMQQQPLAKGAIEDALAAVDLGEKANPQLTDWKKLRADLTALLDNPPDQKKQQQDQQKQDDQKPDQQKNDQQQQQQQQQSQSKDQQDQNKSDQNQSQQSSDEQKQQQQNQDSSGQSQDQQPPAPAQSRPEEGQMGEMKPQQNQAEVPPPADKPAEPPKMRKVGARPADNQPPPTDAETALLQQRMREAADKDSPARLFQLMEGTDKQAAPRGRDW